MTRFSIFSFSPDCTLQLGLSLLPPPLSPFLSRTLSPVLFSLTVPLKRKWNYVVSGIENDITIQVFAQKRFYNMCVWVTYTHYSGWVDHSWDFNTYQTKLCTEQSFSGKKLYVNNIDEGSQWSVRQYVCPLHSCECNIWEMHWGHFFKFSIKHPLGLKDELTSENTLDD